MKINNIYSNYAVLKNNYQSNGKINSIHNVSLPDNMKYAKLPSTNNYLAFLGGYSLDLAQTYKNLDENEYPPDIKENVKKTLENNEKNKTLYDVHYEKYKGVLDCYSLDELKQKYPEFSCVESAYEVSAEPESFVGQFQNDELELFQYDEDLTLQLIKLYWGEGLSLNDLSNYIKENSVDGKGKSLYYAMSKKLNIPLMKRNYAHVLKLSDKEYNEHFTKALSEKLIEAQQRRIQKQEGEPVYIPRGALTKEHKEHISQSLKEYYENNPAAVYNLSNRQKKYYEDNPDAKERLSNVLDYAWNNTREGQTVKKYLSKFAKKQNQQLSDDELTCKKDMNSQKSGCLKDFWAKNSWAREKWSIAMKKGYEYQSEFEKAIEFLDGKSKANEKLFFSILPTAVVDDIENHARKTNFDYKTYNFRNNYIYSPNIDAGKEKIIRQIIKKANNFVNSFIMLQDEAYLGEIAGARQCAIIDFKNALENNSNTLPESLRGENNINRINMNFVLQKEFDKNPIYMSVKSGKKIPKDGIDNGQLTNIICNVIMCTAFGQNNLDVPQYFQGLMDKYYGIDAEMKYRKLGLI